MVETVDTHKEQHQFYIGIDLHARTMYVCVMDNIGSIVCHKNMPSTPECLQHVISSYGTNNVIGVECIFTWYWIADFCSDHSLPFALGHALYMKAIHGGKAKNDRIDSVLEKRKMKSSVYRSTLPEQFTDDFAQKTIKADMFLADTFHTLIYSIEKEIKAQSSVHDPHSLELLQTVPV